MRLEATGSSRLRRKDICVSISARCRSSEVEKSICDFVFATPDQDVKLAVGCAKGRLASKTTAGPPGLSYPSQLCRISIGCLLTRTKTRPRIFMSGSQPSQVRASTLGNAGALCYWTNGLARAGEAIPVRCRQGEPWGRYGPQVLVTSKHISSGLRLRYTG